MCFSGSVIHCPPLWQAEREKRVRRGHRAEEREGGWAGEGEGKRRGGLDVRMSLGFFRQSYYKNANQLLPGSFAYSMLCSLKQDEYA